MRIHSIGFPGRALLLTGVIGLLAATTPVVHGQQTVTATPVEGWKFGSLLGSGGPEIGVTVRDVTADDAAATTTGAVVERVRGESPAEKAGVQAGDVIVTYDGETVRSARQLARLIDETPVNKTVALTVARSGKRMDVSVTPQSRNTWDGLTFEPNPLSPDFNLRLEPRVRALVPELHIPAAGGRLGVQTQELTAQLGEYFGASSGVLVTSVGENTPARTAGLRAGDVITAIDGQKIENTVTLRQRLAGKMGKVDLTVVRDRSERTISVNIESGTSRLVTPRRYER